MCVKLLVVVDETVRASHDKSSHQWENNRYGVKGEARLRIFTPPTKFSHNSQTRINVVDSS